MPPDKRSTSRRHIDATAAGEEDAESEEQAATQAAVESGEPPAVESGAALRSPTVLSPQELRRLRARLVRKYH
ncbi:hypothetical protein ACFZDK_40130 [Streptomyces sp. NPDC007901]|uniref:hypothetical protein n=1 Tax=Streptomyces sp. NPDC007901 TaxID=3364785 RepID=UPI0036E412E9